MYTNGERGSPQIAIDTLLEHSYKDKIKSEVVFLFIESDRKRFDTLNEVLDEKKKANPLPDNVIIDTIHDQYHTAFSELLERIEADGDKVAPTFAFIDPFGVSGIPMKVIRQLMTHPSCEVFINCMIGSIHRFVTAPEFEEHCDDLFGNHEWIHARNVQGREREEYLRALYQERLHNGEDGANARYVRYFTMKNSKNRTIYDLFFATNHPSGIDAMKDAMWAVDRSGDYVFSDATNPDQETLFSNDTDWERLVEILVQKYSGRTVPWVEVEEAIRNTPYRIKKRPLQAVAKRPDAPFTIIPGPNNRRYTLNEYSDLQFD